MNIARCLFCFLALFSFLIPSTGWGQIELFSEDFQSASLDNRLVDQGVWQQSHMTKGEVVVEKQEGNQYAASNTGENEFCQIDKLPLHLNGASVVIVSFDFYLEDGQGSVALGIGPNGRVPAVVGVVGAGYTFTPQEWGRGTYVRSPSGPVVRPAAGQWIRVQSRWDLADNDGLGSATFAVHDADGETKDFTTLFFDRQQSQEKVSLEITPENPPHTWGRIWFRLKNARIDNIRVEAE